jgi:hypothetical protein
MVVDDLALRRGQRAGADGQVLDLVRAEEGRRTAVCAPPAVARGDPLDPLDVGIGH